MAEVRPPIPMPEIAGAIAHVLGERPAALITDIDGTISHIALTPNAATVEPAAAVALRALARRLDLVAVMSGRGAADAARMVDIPEVLVVGNHGMEWLAGGRLRVAAAAEPFKVAVERTLDDLERTLRAPGVVVERKGITGSVHYRGAPQPDLAKSLVLDALVPLAQEHGLRLTEGRMVVEVRPPVQINKGTALVELVSSFGLESVVFLGDDVTDFDAMRDLRRLRDAGQVSGCAVGVLARETRPDLVELADFVVDGVGGCVELLADLAVLLDSGPGEASPTALTGGDSSSPGSLAERD